MPASVYVSEGEPWGYGRNGNPGWEALEQALGAIEGAEAVAFASGQAATMALMLCLAPGRRIVLPNNGYYNTRALAARLRPHGAEPVPVDLLDPGAVDRELRAGPAVLWAETPTNPLLRVADLARLGELASGAGAPMVVDNTVATALLQRPLELGAIASLYSLTKALSGHSDVLLGAVVTRDRDLLCELAGVADHWRWDPRVTRELAGAPRHEDAAPADHAAVGERAGDSAVSGRSPPGERGALPRRHRCDAGRGRRADDRGIRAAPVVRAGWETRRRKPTR